MTLSRLSAWTLLAAAGFALSARPAAAQGTPLPQKNNAATNALNGFKAARGIPAADLAAARGHFKAFAEYYAGVVAHELVHRAPQDSSLKVDSFGTKLDPKDGRPIPTIDVLIQDLERFILVPKPTEKIPNSENFDYMRELGTALDAALKPLVETHPDRIVRVNAARLYATACASGAAAHWPTVTALLTNANTPTEVKYYILQAAANLLAAHDVHDLGSRRHSLVTTLNAPRPEMDAQIGALVAALQACVTDPNLLVSGLPGGKIADANPDQIAVAGFLRRQAVRALAQVRFAALPGPDGKALIHPAATLARVCVSDPALVPAPGPAECAEAALGIANMAPVWNQNRVKEYNPAAAAEAVTAAVATFAARRANDPLDKSTPWRGYALRLGEGLKNWRPLFDPGFDPRNPAKFTAADVPAVVNDTIANVQTLILTPIEAAPAGNPALGPAVQFQKLVDYLRTLRENPKRNPLLFANLPASSIDAPPPKAAEVPKKEPEKK